MPKKKLNLAKKKKGKGNTKNKGKLKSKKKGKKQQKVDPLEKELAVIMKIKYKKKLRPYKVRQGLLSKMLKNFEMMEIKWPVYKYNNNWETSPKPWDVHKNEPEKLNEQEPQDEKSEESSLAIKSSRCQNLDNLESIVENLEKICDCIGSDIMECKLGTAAEKRDGELKGSPIDIDTDLVEICRYQRLNFDGLFDRHRETTIYNTGVTVEGVLQGEVFLSNGPLFGNYIFESFDLHFGEEKDDGTEHTLDGKRFTLELQIKFKPSSDYLLQSNEESCRSEQAILSVLFQETRSPTHYDLFSLIPNIANEGKKVIVENNLLYDFKDVLSSSEYYNYLGSSTTDGFPNVEWLIFKNVLPINKKQMKQLRMIRSQEECEGPNIEPTKELGTRKIFMPIYLDHLECRGKLVCTCYRPKLYY